MYWLRAARFVICLFIGSLSALSAAAGDVQPMPAVSDTPPAQSDTTHETIRIDGEEYPIGHPWLGGKIKSPHLTFESFRRIPDEFAYNGTNIYVRETAFEPLLAMLEKARSDGIILQVESGYRSVGYQRTIFTRMIQQGRTFADIIRYVAPPGYSEHVLGTAVDFHPSNWLFAEKPAYNWLQKNAATFHFEESYPQHNKRQMPWEAWHWKYIGN